MAPLACNSQGWGSRIWKASLVQLQPALPLCHRNFKWKIIFRVVWVMTSALCYIFIHFVLRKKCREVPSRNNTLRSEQWRGRFSKHRKSRHGEEAEVWGGKKGREGKDKDSDNAWLKERERERGRWLYVSTHNLDGAILSSSGPSLHHSVALRHNTQFAPDTLP